MVYRLMAMACLSAAAGCYAGGWPVLPPPVETSPLPEGPRQPISVEVPRLDIPRPSPPTLYRHLTVEECRRRAFQATPLADVLTTVGSSSTQRRYKHDQEAIWSLIRAYAADELRNRHIAEALGDFYRLAAAEGQYDRLHQAEQLLQEQVQTLEKAVQQGVRPAQDLLSAQRQLLEVRSRLAQLDSLRVATNASLAERLGLPTADPPLWPVVTLRVDPRDIAVEAAVDLALTYRPDLNLLRLLLQLDGRSLTQTEGLFQAIHPLLSAEPPPSPFQTLLAELRKAPTLWEQRWRSQLGKRCSRVGNGRPAARYGPPLLYARDSGLSQQPGKLRSSSGVNKWRNWKNARRRDKPSPRSCSRLVLNCCRPRPRCSRPPPIGTGRTSSSVRPSACWFASDSGRQGLPPGPASRVLSPSATHCSAP